MNFLNLNTNIGLVHNYNFIFFHKNLLSYETVDVGSDANSMTIHQ